jgi:electron transfer flavoprotein beta subunit
MRVVVCTKQVYDPKTVRISRSREELDLREAVKIMNPPDRYALEAGLRLRQELGGEVIALTLGDAEAEETAREAIAIGADRAVLVSGNWKGEAKSCVMAAVIRRLAPVVLVLTGEISMIDGSGSLAARLASVLGWPVLLDAVHVRVTLDGGLEAVVIWTPVLAMPRGPGDGGRTMPVPLPSVLSILPGPKRPRYPSPARIARAWDPGLLDTWTTTDLGLDPEALVPHGESGRLILRPQRVRGQVIGGTVTESAERLVDLLHAARIA